LKSLSGRQELHVWIDLKPEALAAAAASTSSDRSMDLLIDFKNFTLHRVPYFVGSDTVVSNTVLGVHFSHDAHIAVVINGVPKFVLELERLVNKRYYDSCLYTFTSPEIVSNFISNWRSFAAQVLWGLKDVGVDLDVINVVVFNIANAQTHEMNKATIDAIMLGLEVLIDDTTKVVIVDHHESHAALGLYDAYHELGIKHPLIYSYDGGGNDGYSGAYIGDIVHNKSSLTKVSERAIDEIVWGSSYAGVGAALPEVMLLLLLLLM